MGKGTGILSGRIPWWRNLLSRHVGDSLHWLEAIVKAHLGSTSIPACLATTTKEGWDKMYAGEDGS